MLEMTKLKMEIHGRPIHQLEVEIINIKKEKGGMKPVVWDFY